MKLSLFNLTVNWVLGKDNLCLSSSPIREIFKKGIVEFKFLFAESLFVLILLIG